ncbi:hypothetical protein MMB17_07425 [Methylobacterium organophilum]|uniref:hypothetical protein n=1 Tax=Methylobacterium organophilum TaxID=410 RepID=UPI001F144433|nr:hypothetical protein [Methylobacterium organophilum]UMY19120.1 hypothetical protein MMB17_07425 [Methylobacterium organophilum]
MPAAPRLAQRQDDHGDGAGEQRHGEHAPSLDGLDELVSKPLAHRGNAHRAEDGAEHGSEDGTQHRQNPPCPSLRTKRQSQPRNMSP